MKTNHRVAAVGPRRNGSARLLRSKPDVGAEHGRAAASWCAILSVPQCGAGARARLWNRSTARIDCSGSFVTAAQVSAAPEDGVVESAGEVGQGWRWANPCCGRRHLVIRRGASEDRLSATSTDASARPSGCAGDRRAAREGRSLRSSDEDRCLSPQPRCGSGSWRRITGGEIAAGAGAEAAEVPLPARSPRGDESQR